MANTTDLKGTTRVPRIRQLLLTFNKELKLHFSSFDVKLKEAFSTAPLLKHANLEAQFIVEVDTSDTGIGAIEKLKMHPVVFFSKKPSPWYAQNSGVTQRKILVVHYG